MAAEKIRHADEVLELARVPAEAAEEQAPGREDDRAGDLVVPAVVRQALEEPPAADGLRNLEPGPAPGERPGVARERVVVNQRDARL